MHARACTTVFRLDFWLSSPPAEALLFPGEGGGSAGWSASPLHRWGGLRRPLRAGEHHRSWRWFVPESTERPGPQIQPTGFHLQAATYSKLNEFFCNQHFCSYILYRLWVLRLMDADKFVIKKYIEFSNSFSSVTTESTRDESPSVNHVI